MLLISQMTPRKHMFKGLCEFMGQSFPRSVTNSPCLVANDQVQVEM